MKSRRIWYGVCGIGWGHTMRARVVAEQLVRRGHQVHLVASGPAVEVLRSHGLTCTRIEGLRFCLRDGGIDRPRTLARGLRDAPAALRSNFRTCRELLHVFKPDAVLTDFESVTSVAGAWAGLPVVSLDHQHVVDRCAHPEPIRARVPGFAALHAACALKTRARRYVVSSFFFPSVKQANTELVGPVLRPALERLTPREGKEVLVYLTSGGDPRVLEVLRGLNARFVVYGFEREGTENNLELRRFDETRFLDTLAGARAVITNGGFTLLGEALALGKPTLSIPLTGQPEQQLNAAWLERLQAGVSVSSLTRDSVDAFLARRFQPVRDPRLRDGRTAAVDAVERALEAA